MSRFRNSLLYVYNSCEISSSQNRIHSPERLEEPVSRLQHCAGPSAGLPYNLLIDRVNRMWRTQLSPSRKHKKRILKNFKGLASFLQSEGETTSFYSSRVSVHMHRYLSLVICFDHIFIIKFTIIYSVE